MLGQFYIINTRKILDNRSLIARLLKMVISFLEHNWSAGITPTLFKEMKIKLKTAVYSLKWPPLSLIFPLML